MKFFQQKMLLFDFFLLLNAINCLVKIQPLFKCEHDDYEETHPLPNRLVKQSEPSKRRIEGEETSEYEDFKIFLDFTNLENDMKTLGVENQKEFYENSMKKAVNTLSSLLKVKPLEHGNDGVGYNVKGEDLRRYNISFWNNSVFGDEAINQGKTFQSQGINLAIFGTLTDLPESTLATASAIFVQSNGQPYGGLVKINKHIDYSKPNSDVYFESILVHEFTHILGFSRNFFLGSNRLFFEVDNDGVNRTYLKGEKLLAVAKKYFNCSDITGVELENLGGTGTAGSHWESRILLGEYMNGYAYTEEQVISEFTLAALEDSGFYKANYYTGGLMRYGKHKGCAFLKDKCVGNDYKINPLFENEFYDSVILGEVRSSCSSGRQSRTYNAGWGDGESVPPIHYFEDEKIFGYEPADYCPVPMKNDKEEELSYFVGHCSIKGSGKYGTYIDYRYYDVKLDDPTSENIKQYTGETFSDHSYCYLSSISKNEKISKVVRGNCYETFCSEKSLTIKIFNDYVVCPRAGGKIEVEGYQGYLLCPDYNLICSGTVICNNIFDCVEKNSSVKEESYIYEYEIKTSQNIAKANDAKIDNDTNYELSTDGKCPQYCKQCFENKFCLKCAEGYIKKMEQDKSVICIAESDLGSGYYKNDEDIYIQCIDNCEACESINSCEKCTSGFVYSKNQCIQPPNGDSLIEHCHQYDKEFTKCEKCEKGYAFNQTDKTTCHDISDFQHYYRKENSPSYYPCSNLNANCSECFYDPKKLRTFCTKCIDDLVLLNKGAGQCKTKEEIEASDKYYLINDTHAGVCNKDIANCISCENANSCKQCKLSYVYDNENNICVEKKEYIKTHEDYEPSLENENDGEIASQTTSETRGRRKVKKKKNSGNYFSVYNIILLEIIYIIFLLVKL